MPEPWQCPVRPRLPGLRQETPTFVAGVEALGADRIVTDETQGESGGRTNDGGRQLKSRKSGRQREAVSKKDHGRNLHIL